MARSLEQPRVQDVLIREARFWRSRHQMLVAANCQPGTLLNSFGNPAGIAAEVRYVLLTSTTSAIVPMQACVIARDGEINDGYILYDRLAGGDSTANRTTVSNLLGGFNIIVRQGVTIRSDPAGLVFDPDSGLPLGPDGSPMSLAEVAALPAEVRQENGLPASALGAVLWVVMLHGRSFFFGFGRRR